LPTPAYAKIFLSRRAAGVLAACRLFGRAEQQPDFSARGADGARSERLWRCGWHYDEPSTVIINLPGTAIVQAVGGVATAEGITPLYVNALPGQHYPIAVTLPQIAHLTVVSTIKCAATTKGSTIIAALGSWSLEAGQCNNATNPPNSSGTQIWDVAASVQALPATGLTAGTTYFIAATQNGKRLSYHVCPLRGTCSKNSVVDTKSLAAATSAVIGGSGSGIRAFAGDIWGVAIYAPLSASQVQALANAAINDPYGASAAPTAPAAPSPSPTTLPPGHTARCGYGLRPIIKR
jgi:hypothetical protein